MSVVGFHSAIQNLPIWTSAEYCVMYVGGPCNQQAIPSTYITMVENNQPSPREVYVIVWKV